MNLPNILTVLRIFLTLIFIALFLQNNLESSIAALGVFTLASVTDFLDGYYARKYHLITRFGKIMDPIADKFLVLSAFVIFMNMELIASWMIILIIIREVGVTGLRFFAMGRGITLEAESAGKLKTVLQIVAIYLIMGAVTWFQASRGGGMPEGLLSFVGILMVLVMGVTVWSGITFIWNNKKEIFSVG